MSVIGGNIAVTSTAVNIAANLSLGVGGLISVKLKNSGATNPIALGGSGVTASAGYQMAPGDVLAVDLEGDDALWAVSTSGSTLQVLALGKEIGG